MDQTKQLQLTLTKISYGGDSIGDDIRVEIEHSNGLFVLNEKIKHGTHVMPKAIVGVFTVTPSIPLTIKVVEQDLVFNDVGSKVLALKIEANAITPQKSTHEIAVQERRGMLPGARIALFAVELEISVGPAIRYIPLTDDGWFVCKQGDRKTVRAIPAYLKVRFNRTEREREYFTPMEGAWQGIELWTSSERDASLRLLLDNPQTDSVQLTYSISQKKLTVSRKTYQTTDASDAPWEKGRYDVEIPDAPHRGGLYYPDVKLARVWFRVGHSGDRYVHTGRHSLGCITVTEQTQWDALCVVLMKARKGDGKSVGVLTVVD